MGPRGVGEGVGDGLGVGLDVGLGVGDGLGVGLAVGCELGVGLTVGVGLGVGVVLRCKVISVLPHRLCHSPSDQYSSVGQDTPVKSETYLTCSRSPPPLNTAHLVDSDGPEAYCKATIQDGHWVPMNASMTGSHA
jgi:hypothetical protein